MREKIKCSYNHSKITCYSFEIIKSVIFVFAVVSIIFTFFIRDANVVGNSMYGTLHDGDKILLTSFNYTPKSGDIVAVNAENMIEKRIIKRVIATEGQTLEIDYSTGNVYVDGVMLEEAYISSFTKKPENEFKFPYLIPDNYIFVMGDNRGISLDSRDSSIGLVPCEDIIGKAQFVFYPFDRIKYLY